MSLLFKQLSVINSALSLQFFKLFLIVISINILKLIAVIS